MTDKEFALELVKVQRLDFVEKVITADNEPYIFVELSPALTAVLPPTLSIIQFLRSEFTVQAVMDHFEVHIVERLLSMAHLAQYLLRSAKVQARKR